jgi:hypothetical protein
MGRLWCNGTVKFLSAFALESESKIDRPDGGSLQLRRTTERQMS